jgi:DNA repair protein SbcD/Mre11
MKFFHTADWHLGKLVQGVYMTEDQRHIMQEFVQAVEDEQPDAVIISGDLYDRAVPPTEAVHLLDEILGKIVLQLNIPVLAIAGNHDSPSRLDFGSKIMRENGLYIVGQLSKHNKPVVLKDKHGEVHFHLIPYCDPSVVRNVFGDDQIRNHNDAMGKIIEQIEAAMEPDARHVFVGHAFVTPYGEEEANTSESERPLAIGGSEYVDARLFKNFHYTALGHLHQAHYVNEPTIRYAGSPLKYSISEEYHRKGFLMVEMDGEGNIELEKKWLTPKRDIRTVEGSLKEILQQSINEDYVFVKLTDDTPVLSPMEKIRSVYPNAMHVERKINFAKSDDSNQVKSVERTKMTDTELFQAFYKEVKGYEPDEETIKMFQEVLNDLLTDQNETKDITHVTN